MGRLSDKARLKAKSLNESQTGYIANSNDSLSHLDFSDCNKIIGFINKVDKGK